MSVSATRWRRLLLLDLLGLVCRATHAEEFDTVCKHSRNNTLTCKTKTVEYTPFDILFPSAFSHVFVLDDREVYLVPRIPSLSCPDMRNRVLHERQQRIKNTHHASDFTMECVTITGKLYPQSTFSETPLKLVFDIHYTSDGHGHGENFLTVEKPVGWFFSCSKEVARKTREGHFYGCYKTRQLFQSMAGTPSQ